MDQSQIKIHHANFVSLNDDNTIDVSPYPLEWRMALFEGNLVSMKSCKLRELVDHTPYED